CLPPCVPPRPNAGSSTLGLNRGGAQVVAAFARIRGAAARTLANAATWRTTQLDFELKVVTFRENCVRKGVKTFCGRSISHDGPSPLSPVWRGVGTGRAARPLPRVPARARDEQPERSPLVLAAGGDVSLRRSLYPAGAGRPGPAFSAPGNPGTAGAGRHGGG